MYSYSAYGLGFNSALALPELIAGAETEADIMIRAGAVRQLAAEAGLCPDHPFHITPAGTYLFFSEVGAFLIREGREILIDPYPNVEERVIRLPLLGAVLAVLLQQRGKLVLHASAVALEGQAVIFVGNKGYGKSTLAAALYGRGHELLADDVVAIDLENGSHPMVLPGFPQLKLYPDAVSAALRDNPDDLPEIAANVGKRSRKAEQNFATGARPLHAVYALGGALEVRISQLHPQEAVKTLIANSYMARFASQWQQNGVAATNLRQCTTLASQIPVRLLERPYDLPALGSVAQAVEEQTLAFA
jgi:hypothetical protein